MTISTDRLERWKQISQMLSAAAIPIVLAVVGWFVQKALSDAGLKKDYVQMALAVLKEAPNKENAELRQWAIAVLDKNSPVPIPANLKSQLATAPITPLKFLGTNEVQVAIECKRAPNKETVEWPVTAYPHRFAK